MSNDHLKQYYEDSAHRFWDPREGLTGRDIHIYPLLNGYSGTVLEYGCGSGSLLLHLALEDRFRKCIGVDISTTALSAIAKAWESFAHPSQGKVLLLEPENDLIPQVPSGTVDIILSLATIEHVLNPYVVLDELHRVASNDAILIGCVPNYAYIKHVLQLLFGIQPRTGTDDPVENWRNVGWDGFHIHTFTQSSFTALLLDCGWQPIKWTGWGQKLNAVGFEALRRRFPTKLSGEITAFCRKIPSPNKGKNSPANIQGFRQ